MYYSTVLVTVLLNVQYVLYIYYYMYVCVQCTNSDVIMPRGANVVD
jgi:hypothetical protein